MEYCSACHDASVGEPGAPPTKAHLKSLDEGQLRTVLTEGPMVAMAEAIPRPQLNDLISYLRSN